MASVDIHQKIQQIREQHSDFAHNIQTLKFNLLRLQQDMLLFRQSLGASEQQFRKLTGSSADETPVITMPGPDVHTIAC